MPQQDDSAAACCRPGVRYLDCRSESEFAAGVVPGSVNLPFPHNGNDEQVEAADFLEDVAYEEVGKGDKIFVGCRKVCVSCGRISHRHNFCLQCSTVPTLIRAGPRQRSTAAAWHRPQSVQPNR